MKTFLIIAILTMTVASAAAWAHGGGLNRYGCHTDHVHGGYHCH